MTQYIGRAVRVYWVNDKDWFQGTIVDYTPERGWHVQYYDGDEEWLPDIFKKSEVMCDDGGEPFIPLPSPTSGKKAPSPSKPKELATLVLEVGEEMALGTFGDNDGMEQRHRLLEEEDEQEEGKEHEEEEEEEEEDAFGFSGDLPERGVILLGIVTGASNLPPQATEELDGRAFFKVLYVEGGAQSTMFRCKTPIYTSSPSDSDLFFPSWDEATFRFEMMMPSDANRQPPGPTALSARRGFGAAGGGGDYASSDSFRLTGEILLAMYRNRAQGGSDFVGQVSFDLTEMASTGTVEFHRSGIQARSLRGSFPLIDRKGAVAGDLAHIDVQLELAWKPGAVAATTALASSSSNAAAMSLKGPPMRGPASVAASSKAGGGASAKKSIAGSASMGPSTKNGASQPGNNMAPPRKIVSGSNKKKREDQYRIERENKALQARLASVTKKGKSSGHTSVKKAEDVYSFDPQPKKSKEEEAGIDPKFLRQVRSASQSELQAQFAAMKKEVSDKEKENRELKATLSRLSLNTKKYTMTLDKIKKTMALNAIPTNNAKAPSKSNRIENTSEAKRTFASGGDEKDDFEQEDGDAKGGDGGGQSRKGLGEARNAEEKEEVILDRELRECVAEHRILQEVRRGLVSRIENAKRARSSAEATLEEARQKEENVRMRLQAASSGSKSNSSNDGNGELQAIERLRAVRLELARTEAARDAGIHLGPLQDSFAELSAIDASLARLIEATELEVDLATKERDKNQEQLRALNENRVVSRLRDGINVMRTVLTRIRRQRRIKMFETGSDTIELEVLRLKLRREQLKE